MTANFSTKTFKIIIDGDSCPVKDIVIRVAKETSTPVLVVASIAHQMSFADENVSLITVDNIPQAADMQIINYTAKGDIVITGDYGLASVVLSKGAEALSPRGSVYTGANIDRLLFQRHIDAKIRRGGGRTKGPKAFTAEDKSKFEAALKQLIEKKL